VAKADIVSSGTVNLTMTGSFNGFYVNVVTGQTGASGGSVPGWVPSRISVRSISPKKSTTNIKKSLTFCPKFSKTDAAIPKKEKHDEPTKSKT